MADFTRRERTEHWVEWVLPKPTYIGELYKVLSDIDQYFEDRNRLDDDVTIDADDEHIILRAKALPPESH